jgi:hypothetical protein
MNWDRMLYVLVLIRMGQELGTDSKLARSVHALVDLIVGVFN